MFACCTVGTHVSFGPASWELPKEGLAMVDEGIMNAYTGEGYQYVGRASMHRRPALERAVSVPEAQSLRQNKTQARKGNTGSGF